MEPKKDIDHGHAIAENMQYCNDLAERINQLADAILAIDLRLKKLEGMKNEPRNDRSTGI